MVKRLFDWLAVLVLLGGTLGLLLAAYASVAHADCLTPWAQTRWQAPPITGATSYEWRTETGAVFVSVAPEIALPCPVGPIAYRGIAAVGASEWSDPAAADAYPRVQCMGLDPGEPLTVAIFSGGFLPAYAAGWPVCERR